MNKLSKKVKIDYPCRWVYKVIGMDKEMLQGIFAALLQDSSYSITASRSSATGKYICLNLEVTVESEEKRIAIYETLRGNPSIKYIL